MRSAEAHRNAEALRGADGHIGAEFARSAQQRKCEQVGRDNAERAGRVGFFKEGGEVVDAAGGVRVLHEHAEDLAGERIRAVVADDDLDVERLGAGADDVDRLRVALFGDENTEASWLSPSFTRWASIMASAAAVLRRAWTHWRSACR